MRVSKKYTDKQFTCIKIIQLGSLSYKVPSREYIFSVKKIYDFNMLTKNTSPGMVIVITDIKTIIFTNLFYEENNYEKGIRCITCNYDSEFCRV